MKDIKKIKIISQKDLDRLEDDKSPKDNQKYIGIELEFYSRVSEFELGQYIIHAGISEFVNLGSDGSVHPPRGYNAYEMRILTTEKNLNKTVAAVCSILNHVDSGVNKTCGMHVHLDMRGRNKEKAFYNLVNSQSLLYSLNPSSRRNNSYCRPTPSTDFEAYENQRDGINKHAFSEHRTIEVRIHAGTLDKHKITNWVKLLIKIVDHDQLSVKHSTLAAFSKEYKLSSTLIHYIKERLEKFKSDPNNLMIAS